jgi:prepilin-type N-terminal cleavage/methylation domain-containing protein
MNMKKKNRRGFTMVELMIAMSIFSMIIAGVMATSLQMLRSGYNAAQYAEMEQEARKALEIFARDARMATKATWSNTSSTTELTLTVLKDASGGTYTRKYVYYPAEGTFCREYDTKKEILVNGILSTAGAFEMKAFSIKNEEITAESIKNDPGTASANTKEIQLNLTCSRSRSTVATASNKVISARFILRNKTVAL